MWDSFKASEKLFCTNTKMTNLLYNMASLYKVAARSRLSFSSIYQKKKKLLKLISFTKKRDQSFAISEKTWFAKYL